MSKSDRTKLLFGPYRPPRLRKGDRATCHFRDCDVVITSWTDAPISWPRGRPVDVPRSHPSLLVDNELARAIRQESAAAIRHHWRVSEGVVWRWRKALGVTGTSPGSNRLVRSSAQQGADAMREKEWTEEECEERRQLAIEDDYGARLTPGCNLVMWWTADELALLGTMSDEAVAKRIGKTRDAVRAQRVRRGIPARRGMRKA